MAASLTTVDSGPDPRVELTGVHISELDDPTPYLAGGELLLTTGIPLAGNLRSVNDYVSRLATRGVVALGLGLGAGTDVVPPGLEAACAHSGLALLLVPEDVPFMQVSRAYWDLVGHSEQADLEASLSLQASLTRLATRPEAVAAVVKVLATALGGWAAYLPADGSAETVWPQAEARVLHQLREETARLGLAGTHAAATFPLENMDVLEYSIVADKRTAGFLAVCAGRALRAADRQLMLTGCMLLAVVAQREWQTYRANGILADTACTLIINGFSDAARLVAAELTGSPLGERMQLLALAGPNLEALSTSEIAEHISGFNNGEPVTGLGDRIRASRLRTMDDGVCYLLLEPPTRQEGRALKTTGAAVRRADSSPAPFAAALSRPMPLGQIAAAVGALRRECEQTPPGQLAAGKSPLDPRASDWVVQLNAYPRADLIATVKSYIRHQGQWEVAARELKLHRNSLRHRIGIVTKLINADLDDPDVSASLWLALRDSP